MDVERGVRLLGQAHRRAAPAAAAARRVGADEEIVDAVRGANVRGLPPRLAGVVAELLRPHLHLRRRRPGRREPDLGEVGEEQVRAGDAAHALADVDLDHEGTCSPRVVPDPYQERGGAGSGDVARGQRRRAARDPQVVRAEPERANRNATGSRPAAIKVLGCL